MTTLDLAASTAVVVLSLASYVRWWRVAQREHYAPGRLLAMASIWQRARPLNIVLLFLVALLAAVGLAVPLVGVAAAVLWLGWPVGLAYSSTKHKLALTARVKRLAAITVVVHALASALLWMLGMVSLLPMLVLVLGELALLLASPLENSLGRKWQRQAAAKIAKVAPRTVAITGSYGKTSTKNYAAHLISGRWSVLASPASFNNAMGLSRTVNDRLVPGTEVFLAEMGTYGPGEIAALCELFPPEVSAITTIGEAHLERMKSRATIVRAKSEILPPASTVVLNVDVPELAEIADELAATKRVIRCSTTEGSGADVVLARASERGWQLRIREASYDVTLPAEVDHPGNVAIAVGLALAVDVPERTIVERIPGIPATPHRAETAVVGGVTVIDDTYNANPDGAAGALAKAQRLVGEGGTIWTITPGMVELGSEQAARNADFARAATATPAMRLCIVGRTNLMALRAGDPSRTTTYASREDAMKDVLAAARPGDVVLYENDLPDHYP